MVFSLISKIFSNTKSRSEQAMALEKKYMAQNYKPLPVVLSRGKGTRVWDADGREYLDFLSAYSAVSAGHSNDRLVKAMIDQVDRLDVPSRAFYNDRLGEFAKMICEISGMDMMLPMNTGAEAVETAIKAARRWGYRVKKIPSDKAKIIVSAGNFHGRTTTIVGFSSEDEYKKDFGPFDGGFITVPFGDAQALEQALKDPHVCAFMTEPMQGEAGINIPPQGFLKAAQELCKKHNALFILDEIQTGLGRTGRDFAFQYEINKPDGLILGKALGGGIYPVSAFLGRKDVLELFEPGSHGSTFGGNPIGAAIAIEALKLMKEERLAEKSAKLGAYMMSEIQAIDTPLIRDVRGSGLWIGVDFDPQKIAARTICEGLKERGVLAKETHETVVRFAPPLTVSMDEVDFALKQFKAVIEEFSK